MLFVASGCRWLRCVAVCCGVLRFCIFLFARV
jgi:hypothetical protein